MANIVLGVGLAASLAFATTAALALDTPEGLGLAETEKGEVLVDANRMSLYIFTADPPGQSVCIGGCARTWPPALAPDEARPMGDFGLISREDGARQWAYKNKPLYGWTEDRNPGDVSGDGVGGKWYLAKP